MTVKIVRVANGEDIIADVQEAYPNKEVYSPIGYFLTNPYQVIVEATAEMLFESGTSDEPQKINDLDLQLFPWIPMSADKRCLVVCIGSPRKIGKEGTTLELLYVSHF